MLILTAFLLMDVLLTSIKLLLVLILTAFLLMDVALVLIDAVLTAIEFLLVLMPELTEVDTV